MVMKLNSCNPQFTDKARGIRLLGIDFDGVMTDNTVFVFQDGREAVRCSRLEGYGLRRLCKAGVKPVIISTESNRVVSARAQKLNIECIQNVEDKVETMSRLLNKQHLSWGAAAFIGNDINDLEVLQRVSLPVIVDDAHECLHHIGAFRTQRAGGDGAVREVCDAIAFVLEDLANQKSARKLA